MLTTLCYVFRLLSLWKCVPSRMQGKTWQSWQIWGRFPVRTSNVRGVRRFSVRRVSRGDATLDLEALPSVSSNCFHRGCKLAYVWSRSVFQAIHPSNYSFK